MNESAAASPEELQIEEPSQKVGREDRLALSSLAPAPEATLTALGNEPSNTVVLHFTRGGVPCTIKGVWSAVASDTRTELEVVEVDMLRGHLEGESLEVRLTGGTKVLDLTGFPDGCPPFRVTVDGFRYTANQWQPEGNWTKHIDVPVPARSEGGVDLQLAVDGQPRAPRGARVSIMRIHEGLQREVQLAVHPETGTVHIDGSLDDVASLGCISSEAIARWIQGEELRDLVSTGSATLDLETGASFDVKVLSDSGKPQGGFDLMASYKVPVVDEGGEFERTVRRVVTVPQESLLVVEGVPSSSDLEFHIRNPRSRRGLGWHLTQSFPGPHPTGRSSLTLSCPTAVQTFSAGGLMPDPAAWGLASSTSLSVRACRGGTEPSMHEVTADEEGYWTMNCAVSAPWTLEVFALGMPVSHPVELHGLPGEVHGPIAFTPREVRRAQIQWTEGLAASSTGFYQRVVDGDRIRWTEVVLERAGQGEGQVTIDNRADTVRLSMRGPGDSWRFAWEQPIRSASEAIDFRLTPSELDAAVMDHHERRSELNGLIGLANCGPLGTVTFTASLSGGNFDLPIRLPRGSYLFQVRSSSEVAAAFGLVDSTEGADLALRLPEREVLSADLKGTLRDGDLLSSIDGHSLSGFEPALRMLRLWGESHPSMGDANSVVLVPDSYRLHP